MATIELEEGALRIGAAVSGQGLNVESSPRSGSDARGKERDQLRARGDEDAGYSRLTFFHKNRRFRFVVDEDGNTIQRSKIGFSDRQLPTSMR
jgi:hypothetical protein